MVATVLQLLGFALVVAAATLVAPVLGILTAGVGLLAAGIVLDRR